jgi:MraZ protein
VVFRGSFQVRTDDKGRLICPVKFREQLGSVFIITKGIGASCLWVMTEEFWTQSFEDKFTSDRFIDQGRMDFERFIRDGLLEATCDSQGRVQISQKLREFAGIAPQSDALVVGMTNRLEIWSQERWDRKTESVTDASLIAAAAEIGIGRLSL